MRIAQGERPWSIKLFAALVVTLALADFLNRMLNPEFMLGELDSYFATRDWSNDMAIVAAFSLLTIALIPILWIYAFASPVARWVVSFFLGLKLVHSLWLLWVALWFADYVLIGVARPLLITLGICALFSTNADGWFEKAKENSPETFS